MAIDPIKVVFQVGQDDYLNFISGSLKDPASADENKKEDTARGMKMVLSDGLDYPQKGVFRAANNQISTQTGSITVEGLFPNPGMLLRPGLFARVKATLGFQKNALVVPLVAVNTVLNLHQLAVVGPDNKVSIKNVALGITTREEAVILSGVNAGDKIVVQGIQKMTEGCTVMPLPANVGGGSDSNASGSASELSEQTKTLQPSPASPAAPAKAANP